MGSLRQQGGGASVASVSTASLSQFSKNPSAGWLRADGSAVSRTTYSALFAEIGESYGAGDGSTTFNVPYIEPEFTNFRNNTSLGSGNAMDLANQGMGLLNDGRILLVGGSDGSAATDKVWLGTVDANGTITWAAGTALPVAQYECAVTILGDGRILLAGGVFGTTVLDTTYFGVVSGNTITWTTGTALPAVRYGGSLNLLPDGRVLFMGGVTLGPVTFHNTTYFGTISGDTITWVSGSNMSTANTAFSAELIDGQILVLGGYNNASLSGIALGSISGNNITWKTTFLQSALSAVVYQAGLIKIGARAIAMLGGMVTNVRSNIIYTLELQADAGSYATSAVVREAGRLMHIQRSPKVIRHPSGLVICATGENNGGLVDPFVQSFNVINTWIKT